MDLLGLFKGSSAQPAVLKDIVAQYQRLRPTRLRLNNELVHRLSRDVLNEGAKRIGMFHNGMLVFENEDETSVLMKWTPNVASTLQEVPRRPRIQLNEDWRSQNFTQERP